jgi:hypothetical protein
MCFDLKTKNMLTIYKYELKPQLNKFLLHKGAEILTVQAQAEIPCIWVKQDTSNEEEKRYFSFFGTGHEIPHSIFHSTYIGTFQMYDGGLVFHLFEHGELND